MERSSKPRNKVFKFLPRAASAVNFHNYPFSPARDRRFSYAAKGFSGPIVSIIPGGARRKSRSGGGGFETQEPTSPKVSCMGQIKHKKRIHKPIPSDHNPPATVVRSPRVVKKHVAAIRRMFGGAKKGDVKSGDRDGAGNEVKKHQLLPPERTPSLGQMRRFASGRDVLANFDWKAQITPVGINRHRDYYSDEDRGASDDEEEEVMIPFSAPMAVGGGVQPRKEVNLWKRRTMAPPRHLQLHKFVTSNS